ncbi:phosphotransferase [Paenibacillus sp. Marseille-Q4541]|uniref:phosphotransferase enzyme family protein n=1 Tax=Paenibacillus sp. Marseille-Q4541 TaxID=2831522 RepID=UPI001BAAE4D1|nr:phosphotransferase [Paenibacillus sp. Marseille-Q4541]
MATHISRELLVKSAASFGFDVETLVFISNSCNEVFQFQKSGLPHILRLSEKTVDYVDNIKAEVHWVRYLAENGVRTSLPITTTDGQLTAVYQENEKWYIATAFHMAPGKFFDSDPTLWGPSLFNKWGETMGEMHRLTETYDPMDFRLKRENWSAAKINNPYLQEGEYRFLFDKLTAIEDYILSLPKDQESYGLIHYDFHPYNFLIDQGDITVFDFDDSIYGWFALDIGVAATHAVWWGSPNQDRKSKHEFAKQFLNEFLTGYVKQNTIDHYWSQQIPTFMDYRNMSSFFWWLSSWDGNEDSLSVFQKDAITNGVALIKKGMPFDGCDIQL